MKDSPNAATSQVPVSRARLESLSTSELVRLADSYGIDIPPELERIFIIEELLEYSDSYMQKAADDLVVNPSNSETAALPKQYNISFVEVIIRDPLWVFVTWEVKGHDRELHEKAGDFKGYCLRVVPLNEDETKAKENTFTIQVSMEENGRYFGFAEHSSEVEGRYVIKLGVIRGDSEFHIAESQPFCLPRLIDNENINNMNENPLVRLSGVQDISIAKSTDRQSRIKRL